MLKKKKKKKKLPFDYSKLEDKNSPFEVGSSEFEAEDSVDAVSKDAENLAIEEKDDKGIYY